MRADSSVAALPMSICPQAMSKWRPSRDVDLVRPVMPCLEEVYGAEPGRGLGGDRAVVDDPPAARRLGFHQPERLARAEERAGEIDVDDVFHCS